jgi:hypothetical protein
MQIMRLSVCNYQTDAAEASKAVEAIIGTYRAERSSLAL